MRNPQVINPNIDTCIMISESNVINDTTEEPITGTSFINVNIRIYNLMTQSSSAVTLKAMTYVSNMKAWMLLISDLPTLTNRRTYFGYVAENGISWNMRPFHLESFAVDDDGLEETWVHQAYQIEIGGGEAWIKWYNGGSPGVGANTFKAAAYEGGIGTTYATLPERVTHRGPVVPV
jgi:hypothetical protein